VGFVVENVALEQVFSEAFGFPRQYHCIAAAYSQIYLGGMDGQWFSYGRSSMQT
jgi:hypothetical protein